MNLIPYLVVWAVLAIIVIVLAIIRMKVARREDASLHMLESEPEVEQQKRLTKEIASVDRWGQILTIVVVLYGLVLAGIYIYHIWQESTKMPG